MQEEILPSFVNRSVLDLLFERSSNGFCSFASFSSYFIALRHFYFYAENDFMTMDEFKAFMDSNKAAGRLKEYVNDNFIPSIEEINKASELVNIIFYFK